MSRPSEQVVSGSRRVRSPLPRPAVLIWHTAASLAIIALVTATCSRLMLVNATTVGFAYLLIVAIATAWGFIEAAIASVAAMLCWNFFFLPPVGQFTIADPQNWVALFAFVGYGRSGEPFVESWQEAGPRRARPPTRD
jgi:K+-sensing histidine kinase KdpD